MALHGSGGNPFGADFGAVDDFIFSQISTPVGPGPVVPANGSALRSLLQPGAYDSLEEEGSDATFVHYPVLNIGRPGGAGGPPGGNNNDGGSGGFTIEGEPYTSGPEGSDTSDPFNFTIVYVGDGTTWDTTEGTITATIMSYVEAAAEFLSAVLAHGFTDDDNGLTSDGQVISLDDLYIEVSLENGSLGGTVAAAEIYAANDWDGNGLPETPAGATLTIDLTDAALLDASGVLDDAILHEMLHALGFGVLWDVAGNDLTKKSKGDLVYYGDAGSAAYGGDIPVEGGGPKGTSGGHWDEAALDNELMTGIVEQTDTMYLANYSLASLEDLGIYTLAEGWEAELDALNTASGDAGGINLLAWYEDFLLG